MQRPRKGTCLGRSVRLEQSTGCQRSPQPAGTLQNSELQHRKLPFRSPVVQTEQCKGGFDFRIERRAWAGRRAVSSFVTPSSRADEVVHVVRTVGWMRRPSRSVCCVRVEECSVLRLNEDSRDFASVVSSRMCRTVLDQSQAFQNLFPCFEMWLLVGPVPLRYTKLLAKSFRK